MPVGNDTIAYRRHLPHLVKSGKAYFVTFRTRDRFVLPDVARTVILDTCVALHEELCWLTCSVVMPDHVHAIVSSSEITLADLMKRLKGRSSFLANRAIQRTGPLWQHESFDHIIRNSESISLKMDYICNNPVRAGLVERWQDYRWIWRACDRDPPLAG